MCGIAGTYQQADGERAVRAMSERLAHRGPDEHGYYSHVDERVSLHFSIVAVAYNRVRMARLGVA